MISSYKLVKPLKYSTATHHDPTYSISISHTFNAMVMESQVRWTLTKTRGSPAGTLTLLESMTPMIPNARLTTLDLDINDIDNTVDNSRLINNETR